MEAAGEVCRDDSRAGSDCSDHTSTQLTQLTQMKNGGGDDSSGRGCGMRMGSNDGA